MKLHNRLLIGLIAGLLLGSLLHAHQDLEWLKFISNSLFQPLGQIFLRLIFMVLVPLVFSALVLGVVELSKGRSVGGVAAKTLGYTLLASALSVLIGISLVNILKPGVGLDYATKLGGDANAQAVATIQTSAASAKSVSQIITELITKNPLESAVRALEGEMIAFMIFTLIFGFALSMLMVERKQKNHVIVDLLEELFAISMRIIEYAMKLAPYAVFAIIFNTALKLGLDVFRVLAAYVAVVVLGLLIQQFVVYSAMLKLIARRSPLEFFKACREVYLYAFSRVDIS